MPRLIVKMVRAEWRSHEFMVEDATDEADAVTQAFQQAADFDFADGRHECSQLDVADEIDSVSCFPRPRGTSVPTPHPS